MTIEVIRPEEANRVLTDSDREMDRRAQEAVTRAIERSKFLGRPVAGYDGERAYLEYPDGSREYEE